MNSQTLNALRDFPDKLEAFYTEVPAALKNWRPASWDGIPSEPFTAIEQICHVRDIEIEGYHVRFQRALDEVNPELASIDSIKVTNERDYANANVADVFASLKKARAETIALLSSLTPQQLDRAAVFEGQTTLRGLVHYLCSHDQQHLSGLQWLLAKMEGR